MRTSRCSRGAGLTTAGLLFTLLLGAASSGCGYAADDEWACQDAEYSCGSAGLAFRQCSLGEAFRFNDGATFQDDDDARAYCEQACEDGELCGVSCGESYQTCTAGRKRETCTSRFTLDSYERFADGTSFTSNSAANAYCDGCDVEDWGCVEEVQILSCPDGTFVSSEESGFTDHPREAELWCAGYSLCFMDKACFGNASRVADNCLFPEDTYFTTTGKIIGDALAHMQWCDGGQP